MWAALLTYWKPVAIVAIIVAIFFAGDFHGSSVTQSKYEAILAQEKIDAAAERDKIVAQGVAQSKALEDQLSAQRVKANTLGRRLANEIKKNSVYGSCIVPDDGVQLYNDSLSGSPASR